MALWKASELDFRSCLRRTHLKAASKPSKVPVFAEDFEGTSSLAEGRTEGRGGVNEEPKPLRYLKGALRYLKGASKASKVS